MNGTDSIGYKLKLGAIVALLLIGGLADRSWATIIQNGGFESPALALGPQGYAYTTSLGSLSTTALANWTLGSSGGGSYAGVISNATWAPLPVSGTQCAFVEGTGVISQLATFAAGPYGLRFDSVMAKMNEARAAALTPPEWVFKLAQKKVKSGDYSFDHDEKKKSEQ